MTGIRNLSQRLLLISALAPFLLLGCQSNNSKSNDSIGDGDSAAPNAIMEDALTSDASTDQPTAEDSSNLMTRLNRYQWQLADVINSPNDKTADQAFIKTLTDPHDPLLLDVRPSSFILNYNCQQYRLPFVDYYQAPFSYNINYISAVANSDCNDIAAAMMSLKDKAALKANLERLFVTDRSRQFYINLEPSDASLASSARKLQFKMNDGATLVWQGQLKPLIPVSGIPITTTLLTRYQWRLKSARNSQQRLITEFSHQEVPITASFNTDTSHPHAGFSTGCNGVGGPYVLTEDQQLLIGSGLQTTMGCSDFLESIETKVSSTLLNSQSQLKLKAASAESNTSATDLPSYLLTQKLETGETLIWKNEALNRR